MTSQPAEPLLEFCHATIGSLGPRFATLREATFSLLPGELVMVRNENGPSPLPLAAAAQGLVGADEGDVRYAGRSWEEVDPRSQCTLRGTIGRVFAEWGWVSNLNVLENVVLAQRHHTRRTETEIQSEADRLARQFGLERVPVGRPAFVPPSELRRAEWVRALLGAPRLTLLEQPLRQVSLEWLPALTDALHGARQRGAAVLWLTADDREWRSPLLNVTRHLIYRQTRLHAAAAERS